MVVSNVAATEVEIDVCVVSVKVYWVKEYSVLHILTNAISTHFAGVITGLTSSAVMWTAVKKDATDKSQMFCVNAKARLQLMKVAEGDVKAHLNVMVATQDALFGISISVPDKDFATMIIGSLPK